MNAKAFEQWNIESSSDASKISTNAMFNILEQLRVKCKRDSTHSKLLCDLETI